MSASPEDAIVGAAWAALHDDPTVFDAAMFLAALRAAGYAVERDWQDISTAPRDGTRFWGKVGDDALSMLWHPTFDAFVSSWRRMEMAPGYTFADTGLGYRDHSPDKHNPTHWRPLPAPPG